MFYKRLCITILFALGMLCIAKAQPVPVPVNKDTTRKITLNGAYYYLFTPKKGQTLYSVAKAYGVSVDDINSANILVKDNGLKVGQDIKIPAKKSAPVTTTLTTTPPAIKPPTVQPTAKTTVPGIPPSTAIKDSVALAQLRAICRRSIKKDAYTIGLFLPLDADSTKGGKSTSSIALEFYEGALLAAEDFKNDSVKLTVQVFDTKNDSVYINDILAKKAVKSLDLVIGPLFASGFQRVSSHMLADSVICVSPFSQTYKVIEGAPLAHKITPTAITIVDQCARFISKTYGNQNVVLLSTNNPKDQGSMSLYRDRLSSSMSAGGLTFKEHTISAGGKIPESLFSTTAENLIIFPSSDQATVALIVSQLSDLTYKFKIKLWGLNQWQTYDNLDLAKLSKVGLLFARTSYADKDNTQVSSINKRCRDKYKTDASEYFYQGYDAMTYYANMLARYGRNLTPCLLCEGEVKGTQTNFKYGVSNGSNGIENIAISIMQYKNNSIVKVN